MSRDLKEIFDLDQLRRAWGSSGPQSGQSGPSGLGTPSAEAVQTASSPQREKFAPPPAPPDAPLRLLDKLDEAIAQELDGPQRPLVHPTVEAIRALLGLADSHELTPARYGDLERHFDELEDLVDALSLKAPAVL
jgi:hypothetical protein